VEKRGKLAKSDAHNLLERLQAHEASVCLFAKDPYVSFTNTGPSGLRMSKVKQKVSAVSEQKLRTGLLSNIKLPANHGEQRL